jgi:integration host factor subunit alpha
MTKADIARIVYERHGGISNREAARLVEVIFETIKRHLGDGEKVQITGFGTFLVRQKRERRGRNPQTGEEMLIRPRSSVVFRPSKLFAPAVSEAVSE